MKNTLVRFTQSVALALFLSFNSYSQWVKLSEPNGFVNRFAIIGTNLFVVTNLGLFRSTNNGTSWTRADSGLTPVPYTNLSVGPSKTGGANLFATVGDPYLPQTAHGVFISTNLGTSWTRVDLGVGMVLPLVFAVSDSDLWVGEFFGGVYRSTNNGTSWTKVYTRSTGTSESGVMDLAFDGTNLFAALSNRGILLSTDKGTNWTQANEGLTTSAIGSLTVLDTIGAAGTIIFATTDIGVFRSTNNGVSWTQVNGARTYCFAASSNGAGGRIVFAGTDGDGVWCSTDNGSTWTEVNAGLTNFKVRSLAVLGTTLFAGTTTEIWRRPLSQLITSVQVATSEMPTQFTLAQNYPNPFNPSTTIRYSLPKATHVSLNIYSTLGQVVAQLVSQEMNAGSYVSEWNASGFASGVYYYKLAAGGFVDTKKLVVLR